MKLPADPELNRGREHQLDPGILEHRRHPRQEVGHSTDQHGSGEHGAHEQAVALTALLRLARRLLGVVHGSRARARLGELVAGGRDRRLQGVDAGPRRVERDGRLLGREIDRRLIDTGDRGQGALDLADARGAVHPAHGGDDVGRVGLRHHLPRNRANTSSSSSIFC
jgi:hypothetical protein